MKQAVRVRDLMSERVVTVSETMTTDALATYLAHHDISGAPVVDIDGRLIGVVSMIDIGRARAVTADPVAVAGWVGVNDAANLTLEDLGQRYVEERVETVREIMRPDICQVAADASLVEVARLMCDHRSHRVVVTEGTKVVGIIASMDVLRMVAENRL